MKEIKPEEWFYNDDDFLSETSIPIPFSFDVIPLQPCKLIYQQGYWRIEVDTIIRWT
jgi:hypothetical protein